MENQSQALTFCACERVTNSHNQWAEPCGCLLTRLMLGRVKKTRSPQQPYEALSAASGRKPNNHLMVPAHTDGQNLTDAGDHPIQSLLGFFVILAKVALYYSISIKPTWNHHGAVPNSQLRSIPLGSLGTPAVPWPPWTLGVLGGSPTKTTWVVPNLYS